MLCLVVVQSAAAADSSATSTNSAPVVPVKGGPPQRLEGIDSAFVTNVSAGYRSGNWAQLKSLVKDILGPKAEEMGCSEITLMAILDAPKGSPVDKARVPVRLAFPSKRSDPFSSRIFGPSLCDVRIEDAAFDIESSYTAQRIQNPLIGSVSKLASTLVGGIKGANLNFPRFERIVPGPAPPPPPPPPPLSAVFTKIVAPVSGGGGGGDIAAIERATIQIVDSFTETADHLKERKEAAEKNGEKPPDSKQSSSLTTSYTLTPLTKLTVGLGAGVIADTSLNTPVNIPADSTKPVTENDLSGLLTFVAVNWQPWGFNESLFSESMAERVRLVTPALIMTPSPGIGVGAGFELVRGLGIVGGYGVLLTPVLRADDTLGSPSKSPGNPTRRGALGVIFVGVEYSLQ